MLSDRLLRVVQLFSRLPGVGEKTAQRYALALLAGDEAASRDLGRALVELRDHVRPCDVCGHVADIAVNDDGTTTALCTICRDPRRDPRMLSPLDGIGRDDLGLDRLVARIDGPDGRIEEVLVATPPSVDGEATALLLSRELTPLGVNVSRIASGVPHGGDLEFADQVTLGRAIEHRRRFG